MTYLKYAIPIVMLIVLVEEISRVDTLLHSTLVGIFKVVTMDDYLVNSASAPSKKGGTPRGAAYTDNMLLPIYPEDEGKNMTLKDFTTKHLREYEPGVF